MILTKKKMDALLDAQRRPLEEIIRQLSQRIDNMKTNVLNELRRDVGYAYNEQLHDFKVDARHSLMRTEQAIAAKLAEMDVPRYDWNETAAGIIKRLNSIEVQLTKIRMKQEEHEKTFVTLGVKLRT